MDPWEEERLAKLKYRLRILREFLTPFVVMVIQEKASPERTTNEDESEENEV